MFDESDVVMMMLNNVIIKVARHLTEATIAECIRKTLSIPKQKFCLPVVPRKAVAEVSK